jgi:BCD family chlorophyll transporter-like MFS transporter
MNRLPPFGWGRIARLGLVQAALGAIVVLTTSTLNRVMVVELALPALLPGLLVALHYLVQVVRPRMGHGTDAGGRSTPWIVGGMAVLALGGVGAAAATAWMATRPVAGMALAVASFALVGIGVSASGTSLLVLLAKRVAAPRRAAAATLVWLMMIVGFVVTTAVVGQLIEPYTHGRLLAVSAGVSVCAFALALMALVGLEGRGGGADDAAPAAPAPHVRFRDALRQVWAEPPARQFTIFVFVAMLAFSAQDLILEPFAGSVFGYSPGASTQLASVQHGGVLVGMLLVAVVGSRFAGRRAGSLKGWTIGGCLASAAALFGLAGAGLAGPGWPLAATVFALGVANGAFSIAAIASMMRMAAEGRERREGVRMGLWGAAQAIAFGIGGLVGTAASDVARWLIVTPGTAYAVVFALEALLFLAAARLAAAIGGKVSARAAGAPGLPAHQGQIS